MGKPRTEKQNSQVTVLVPGVSALKISLTIAMSESLGMVPGNATLNCEWHSTAIFLKLCFPFSYFLHGHFGVRQVQREQTLHVCESRKSCV